MSDSDRIFRYQKRTETRGGQGEKIEAGRRFNRWRVLEDVGTDGTHRYMRCRCSCGSIRVVKLNVLRSAASKSCGCLRRERSAVHGKKHGWNGTPEYSSWQHMKQRCLNDKSTAYRLYGGRGISIYEPWIDSFALFIEHMGKPSSPNLTLDRIDTDGNYEPGNVRWATRKQQANNKRNARLLTLDGETKSLIEWSDELDIKAATIRGRLHRGFSDRESLTHKKGKHRKRTRT